MLNCIIWDNDGTLIDTASLFHDANKQALLSENIIMDEALFKKIFQKQGQSILQYYAQKNALSQKKMQKLYAIRQNKYMEMLQAGASINYDAYEFIAHCRQQGIKNFMVTGSSSEELSLEYSHQSHILSLFDGIITASDYINPKPHPDCFMLVLKKWHIDGAGTIVIDDTPRGIIAAKRAGLRAFRYNPFTPKSRYRNLANLLQSLRKISDE